MKLMSKKCQEKNSQNAVVPEVVGVTLVNVAPPAVYAVPEVFVISSDVE